MRTRERKDLLAPLPPRKKEPATPLPSLEPLELHSGMVTGRRRSPHPSVPVNSPATGVREVLEEILLPAVSRSPCMVAFSGGRDSSAILAMATEVARRHGCEDPVPITLRYDEHPRTWETEWQEDVIRHLQLREWEILPVAWEFDLLGPLARQALSRHGLFWPANAYTMVPLLKAASGGTLITGNGGDETFTALAQPRKMTFLEVVRTVPPRRALPALAISLLPARWGVRVRYWITMRLPWLRPSARREVRNRFVENTLWHRAENRHYLETMSTGRYLELIQSVSSAFAMDTGTTLVEPFLNPRFSAAARAAIPSAGFPSRNVALQAFFGDLLPEAIVRRSTKASFTEVFWGPASREFANEWDGSGLDHSLVDPEALRREWMKPRPDFRSATPLQAAWSMSTARAAERRPAGNAASLEVGDTG